MLVLTLKNFSKKAFLKEKVSSVLYQKIDLVELRLDFLKDFSDKNLQKLQSFTAFLKKPVILTLRTNGQGGFFKGSQKKYFKLVYQGLLKLNPSFVDLEYEEKSAFKLFDFMQKIKKRFPSLKIILSQHGLQVNELEKVLCRMQKLSADHYKLIFKKDQSSLEVLESLQILKKWAHKIPVTIFGLGEKAFFSRLLAPLLQSQLTYFALNAGEKTAVGQLVLSDFVRYRLGDINHKTALYALLGDPVDQSPSNITHNKLFQMMGINAMYLKIPLLPCEISLFFQKIQSLKLNFQGFSITAPLKEVILKALDKKKLKLDLDILKIGALNTLVRKKDKWLGFNTDVIGVSKTLERAKLKNRSKKRLKIAVIGNGGAARAVIWSLKKHGVDLLVFSRHPNRSKRFFQKCNAEIFALSELKNHLNYDLLINASSSLEPIEKKMILKGKTVFDLHINPKAPLLQTAIQKKGRAIFGFSMFVFQAKEQFRLWLFR